MARLDLRSCLAAVSATVSLGCSLPQPWPPSRLVPPEALAARVQDPPWAKLVAIDERGRVLVVKWRGQWEIPGTEMPAAQSHTEARCREFLKEFAAELGVLPDQPRLAGVFLQHFETDAQASTVFRWYAVRAVPGAPPADAETAWMSVADAIAQIPYPMGKRILERLTARLDAVWTAEYAVNYAIDPAGGTLRVIRDFEPLVE